MKSYFLILFSFISLMAVGQDTSFTAKDFDSAQVYYKTRYIPDAIKKKITGGYEKLRMANPGKRFSSGCTGMAPHNRLICLVKLKNRYILYSEHGGRAYYTSCILYEISYETIKATWDIDFVRNKNLSFDTLKETLLKHQYNLRKHEYYNESGNEIKQ